MNTQKGKKLRRLGDGGSFPLTTIEFAGTSESQPLQ